MTSNTAEWRQRFARETKGLTIENAEWDDVDRYWVLTFTNGNELCVRLLADEVRR